MLNDITIEQCVDHQDLILPYTEKQLNPNSYDVTLQDTIVIFAKDVKDGYADACDHTLHGIHTKPVRIDGHYMLAQTVRPRRHSGENQPPGQHDGTIRREKQPWPTRTLYARDRRIHRRRIHRHHHRRTEEREQFPHHADTRHANRPSLVRIPERCCGETIRHGRPLSASEGSAARGGGVT